MKNRMSQEGVALSSWIAKHLVEDCRSGHQMTATLCRAMHNEQVVRIARKLIQESDFEWIKKMCDSAEEDVCRLGLSLMRPLAIRRNLREFFLNLWTKWENSYPVRAELLHRITDFEDLPITIHKELFSFVVNNWESWIDAVRKWTGGSRYVIDYCKRRLADPDFPVSKHWVYLCSAVASNNPSEARELITDYMQQAREKLNQEVVSFLEQDVVPAVHGRLPHVAEQLTMEILAVRVAAAKIDQFIATQRVRFQEVTRLQECKGRFLFKAPLLDDVYLLCTLWDSLQTSIEHCGKRFAKERFRREVSDEMESLGVFFSPLIDITLFEDVPKEIIEKYKEHYRIGD
jgi:hypothetical protein